MSAQAYHGLTPPPPGSIGRRWLDGAATRPA